MTNKQDFNKKNENSNKSSNRNNSNFSKKDNRNFREKNNEKFRDRQGFQNNRGSRRPIQVETLESIQQDITRIEKEIQLEIMEIKSLKLGM